MKEPREDDERLSALIEGQVRGRERDELLAHVAASDDDYEVFTDTAAVLQALEGEEARAGATTETPVIPLPDVTRRRGAPIRLLAIAASVVGVVLISTLALPRRESPAHEPLQLAARVHPANQGLPEDWRSPTQSGARGPAGGAADDALAVYAGAMLVDISIAARAGDTAQTRELATRLSSRSEPGASAAAPLQRIIANPGAPADSLVALLDQATDRLADLGRRPLELGAWTEAARLAARQRDEEFFGARATRGMLGRAERIAGNDATTRAAVDRVRENLPAGASPRWDLLEQNLTALQDALAR